MKRDKFDSVFSSIIRARAGHQCEKCSNQDRQMHCAHIFGRRHRSVRWCLDNALCLCSTCHRMFTENPIDFTRFLEDYMGTEALDKLRLKAWKVRKWTKAEKADLYCELKAKLVEYE